MMNNDLENIDRLYRSKLKHHQVSARSKKLWFLLMIKLFLLNLSVSAMIFTGTAVIIIGGTTAALIYLNSNQNVEAKVGKNHLEGSTKAGNLMPRMLSQTPSPFETEDHFEQIQQRQNHAPPSFPQATEISHNSEHNISSEGKSVAIPDFSQPMNKWQKANSKLDHVNSFKLSGNYHCKLTATYNPDRPSTFSFNDNLFDSLFQETYPGRRFSIEAFVNPGMAINNQATTWSNLPDRTLKINHDPASFTFGAGADLKYHFGNWLLATGINYRYLHEQGTYEQIQQVYDLNLLIHSYDTVVKLIYDPPVIGEPIIIRIDTFFISGYYSRVANANWKQTNHLIEFPFLIGYCFKANSFDIEVNSGLALGISIRQGGGIPVFDAESNLIFKKAIATDYALNDLLSAGITIPYRERIRILLKPEFRYNLTDYYKNDTPGSKPRTMIYGLRMGIIYEL